MSMFLYVCEASVDGSFPTALYNPMPQKFIGELVFIPVNFKLTDSSGSALQNL